MIVRTSSNLTIEVSKERAEAIKKALRNGVEYIDIDDTMLKASSIMSVEISPMTSRVSAGKTKLCLPTTTLTDTQREKNILRIREMKQRFLERVSK